MPRHADNERDTGVYVHIPFCNGRCAYCDFVSSVGQFDARAYVAALCREITERAPAYVDTVFIGGGTPSVLPRGALTEILQTLRSRACFSADCEITCEANPESCSDAFLREAVQSGVNRLSLGVQSLCDEILASVGRRHTAQQALAAVARAKAHGIQNINCDLMLGLPHQSAPDVAHAVNALAACGVTHVSAYALTVEEGTPLHRAGFTVNGDYAAELYDVAWGRLRALGFERYEVSNFCRPRKRCRHNYKYWTLSPYVGVGAAAHSYNGHCRSYNTSDIAAYIRGERNETVQTVTAADTLEEYILLGLRTADGISFAALDRLCGGDWAAQKRDALRPLLAAGLLEYTAGGIRLGEKAFYTMNEVIVRLL